MLTNMTPPERERLAYTEGFTESARLLAALSDAEDLVDGLEDANTEILDLEAMLHEAELDRDLYLEALQAIYDGVNAGTLTTGGCMMLAGRVIP
jgi:hypothetical protein